MNIYVVQMDVVAGRAERNFAAMEQAVERARACGADLVVFPEMCVGGYMLADRWTDESFVEYLDSFNDRVRALSRGIGIIWGNVSLRYFDTEHSGKDGRPARYNMAFFAADGQWVPRAGAAPAGRVIKTLQPTYRMFDDERYFTSSVEDAGFNPQVGFTEGYVSPFLFEVGGTTLRIGIEICEDMWSGDYAFDATAHYTDAGCNLIVNISSSPWTIGKDAGRDKRVAEHVRENGAIAPLLYVNAVGMQNTSKNVLGFDGGSTLYDEQGRALVRMKDSFEEQERLVCLADARTHPTDQRIAGEDKLLCALVSTLRRFDEQIVPWHPAWIIGLSGGIDSSVTAALLVMALGGPERIHGFNLPTRYNSATTKGNAKALADALGIPLRTVPIEPLVDATNDALEQAGVGRAEAAGLAQENIQARLRGHVLSTFAQVLGGVVMNNGNKVEALFGYATLYGDAIGAISPLGDITKVRLFDVARAVNRSFGRQIVPENLIPALTDDGYAWEMPPSAELADDQRDPMKWFYHDWLVEQLMDYPGYGAERVMEAYLEDRLQSLPVARWVRFYGLDHDPRAFVDDLEWVLGQMEKNVFKRIQMPPNITVSRGSFGMDFRENQGGADRTLRYRALKEAILELV